MAQVHTFHIAAMLVRRVLARGRGQIASIHTAPVLREVSKRDPGSGYVGSGFSDPRDWENDPRFQEHKKGTNTYGVGGQQKRDFKMGPYAGGKWIVSPAANPVGFITNCILIFTTVYTLANLSWGESYFVKRKRIIRDRIRKEFDLPEGWDDEIEGDGDVLTPGDDAPLSAQS
uniref:Uncharacterized protein n=1 Tax=Oxyrrhis marina TaxID=2969 RepID=A0A7S4GQH5_OXYMA